LGIFLDFFDGFFARLFQPFYNLVLWTWLLVVVVLGLVMFQMMIDHTAVVAHIMQWFSLFGFWFIWVLVTGLKF
jgi:CDP-diacylglycerol--serine O-phosphatidyltransferase